MNNFEKIYSIFAIVFAATLVGCLVMFPRLRQLDYLLMVCSTGFVINMGLMFIVLRDIFLRAFKNPVNRLLWLVLVLFFWPTIVYYLPKYGFQPRIT